VKPVWYPSPEYTERARLNALMKRLGVGDYAELYRVSVEEPKRFWRETLEELEVGWTRPYERFVDLSRGPAWPEWFVGGELNVSDVALAARKGPRPAARPRLGGGGRRGPPLHLPRAP